MYARTAVWKSWRVGLVVVCEPEGSEVVPVESCATSELELEAPHPAATPASAIAATARGAK